MRLYISEEHISELEESKQKISKLKHIGGKIWKNQMNRSSVTYNTKFPEGTDMSGSTGGKKKTLRKKDCDLPNLVKKM